MVDLLSLAILLKLMTEWEVNSHLRMELFLIHLVFNMHSEVEFTEA